MPAGSVAYIANNSRTYRPSVPKFGRKVPHLRCDLHTSFKVKRSKVRVRGGRGHAVSAEPGGHSACFAFVVCLYACLLAFCNLATGIDFNLALRASISGEGVALPSNADVGLYWGHAHCR